MQIAEQLVLLAELASVDAKGKGISDKLESLPAAARKAETEAAALQKQIDDATAKKETTERERKAIDGDIIDERQKIKKWEARASELKGEREHDALVSEVGTAKRTIRQHEDRQLTMMETIEQHAGTVATAKPKHQAALGLATAEWKKVEAELAALNSEKAKLQQAREAVLAKLPTVVTKRYDVIAAKRKGVGVGLIKGDRCTACHMTLPAQLCIQVRRGQVLESCPSCNRFLVHEDMTRAQTEA